MKELQETITFLEQQIEKLKDIRDGENWKPKVGEEYYYFNMDLDICSEIFSNHSTDLYIISVNNCFQTKEEAQKYAEHFKQILKNREL